MDDYHDILFFCDSPRLRPAAADGLHLGRPADAGGGVGGPGVDHRLPASSGGVLLAQINFDQSMMELSLDFLDH